MEPKISIRWGMCVIVFSSLALDARAVPLVAVERGGKFQPVGTLVRFDSEDPDQGTVVGNTGLSNVGVIDWYQGQLWAASSTGGILRFYTIDINTAQATFVSSAGVHSPAVYVFGGAFDSQGQFWITNLGQDVLSSFNPFTGQLLSSVPIAADPAIPGIEFIGDTLYAISAVSGTGRFGTLDTQTGAFTQIGQSSGGGSNGLDYDPLTNTLLVTFTTGGADGPDSELYSINPATGVGTSLGDLIPRGTYDAIAIIPEPAMSMLFLLGLGGLLGRGRKRCKLADQELRFGNRTIPNTSQN